MRDVSQIEFGKNYSAGWKQKNYTTEERRNFMGGKKMIEEML